jgi:hypothetical protein
MENRRHPLSQCREWPGARNDGGYGQRWVNGKVVYLHRWVWEQVNGPIPPGMVVMHTCDNPPCFLYEHLRLGTYADNSADSKAKGRNTRGEACAHRGEEHGRHKLTEHQVSEIRIAIAAGELQRVIAARYGVGQNTISRIKTGESWSEASPAR